MSDDNRRSARFPRGPTGATVRGRAAALWQGRRANRLLLAGVFFATVAALASIARLGIDPHHQGLIFKEAVDALSGQVPFRDSFNQYGLVPPYIQAGFLLLFGSKLIVLNLATVFVYGVASVCLVALWRQIVPWYVAVLAWAVWLLADPELAQIPLALLPWSSAYSLAFTVAAALAFLVGVRRSQPWVWGLLAGALIGAAILSRLPVGVSAGIALAAALVLAHVLLHVSTSRILFAGAIGTLVVVLGACAWMAGIGGFGQMWDQLVQQPSRYLEFGLRDQIVNQVLVSLRTLIILTVSLFSVVQVRRWLKGRAQISTGSHGYWAMRCVIALGLAGALWLSWPWLSVNFALGRLLVLGGWAAIVTSSVFLIGACSLLWPSPTLRRAIRALIARAHLTPALIVLSLLSTASYFQVVPIFDERHIWWAGAPSLGLLLWLVIRASSRQSVVVVLTVSILALPSAASSMNDWISKLRFSWENAPALEALEGMRVTPEFLVEYGELAAGLAAAYQRTPDAPVLNDGNDALWSALGKNVDNPDPYFLAWPAPGDALARGEFVQMERPLIWFGYGDHALAVRAAKSVGYRVVATKGFVRPGDQTAWLLIPGDRVRRPPYTWNDMWGAKPFWTTSTTVAP